MVCAAKGYPLSVTMAESFSIERRRADALPGRQGHPDSPPRPARYGHGLAKTIELAKTHGWFMTRQFENEAKRRHALAAPQPPRSCAISRVSQVDWWVTGYGTGGTLKGPPPLLREKSPKTPKILVCEPSDAPLLSSGQPQAYNADRTPAAGHPAWKPHPYAGLDAFLDFIPKLTGDAVDLKARRPAMTISGPRGPSKCSRDSRRRKASSSA